MMSYLLNILIYCFIILVPLLPMKEKFKGIPIAIDFLFGSAIVLIFLASNLRTLFNRKTYKDKRFSYIIIFSVVFIILSVSSIFYAKNKTIVLSETFRFIEYITIFTILYLIVDKRVGKNILTLFGLTMILVAFLGCLQFAFNLSEFRDSVSILNRGRLYSTFVNPNYYGAAINLVIFYFLINFIESDENRLLNILLFMLLFFNLLMTLTRGSWMGFFVGILIIAFFRHRKLFLSLPIGLIVIGLIPSLRMRLGSIFDLKNLTNSERLTLWKTGLLMFKDHILIGVGNGNYLYRYKEYITRYPELNLRRSMFSVHNSYIKMLAELGIFGGIIFIVIYFMLAYLTYTVYKNTKDRELKQISLALLAGWGAYLFQNFFNNLMFIPQLNVLVWVLTAVVYKLYLIEGREVNG